VCRERVPPPPSPFSLRRCVEYCATGYQGFGLMVADPLCPLPSCSRRTWQGGLTGTCVHYPVGTRRATGHVRVTWLCWQLGKSQRLWPRPACEAGWCAGLECHPAPAVCRHQERRTVMLSLLLHQRCQLVCSGPSSWMPCTAHELLTSASFRLQLNTAAACPHQA
jgi:hypothetical protein